MEPAEPRWYRIAAALVGRLDGVQIADLLWMTQQLAVQIEKRPQADPDRPAGPTDTAGAAAAAAAAAVANLARETKGGDQASAASGKGPPPQQPEVPVDPVAGAGAPPAGSLTVSVAEAGLLHRQRRRIGRALAPLNRQVESGPARLLDVRATVDAIARARVDRNPWLPVLRPRPEPWLTLHLVFDDHPSMALWQQLRRELPRTLAQQVRWRDLRCWRLSRAGTGELELLGAHGRRCSPRQLRQPGGREVVLVVSDAIAPCWRDGAMARQLGAWASQAPVLLLQVLPPRLWPRTGLGQQEPGWVLARRSLQPNGTLNWLPAESDPFAEPEADGPLASPPPAPAAFTLPLASLEPESLAALARLLAGRAPGSLRAFRFAPPPETPATAPPAPQPAPEPDSQAIEQQLALFLFNASPQARRLLGLLTFAPVLTLPVVRLIQRLELAGSGPAQIAEVLFSGLFRNVAAPPAKGEPRVPADRQRLVFVEEALRGRLREGLRVGEARAVFDAVKAHVAASLNCSVESFEALLRQPPPAGSASASELLQAFATVAPSCLRGLGGRYDELADATEAAWAAVPQPVGPAGEKPAGPVNALVLLGDGRLAAAGGDGAIRLWDPASGTCTAVFAGEGGPVLALAQLGDGRLASGGGDGAIRLWDLASGTCTAVLEGHGPWVRALAVVANGGLASGSDDGTIRVWDPASGACTVLFQSNGGPVKALAVLADGRLALGCNDGSIRLWDPATDVCSAVLEGHGGPVYALAALADGRLASGATDRTIRLWDPGSATCTRVLEGHNGSVAALVGLADGRLASGSFDQTIRLWDPSRTPHQLLFERHGGPVRALRELPDGRLACFHDDLRLRLWFPVDTLSHDLEPLVFETAWLEEITLQPITFTTSVLDGQLRQRDSQGQAWALREPLRADGSIGLTMVQIPAGSFVMGSPPDEPGRFDSEGPQHEVTLQEFWMSQTQITQAQWREVAGWEPGLGEKWGRELKPDPSHFNGDDRPVERVNWFDAMEFCNRLSQRTGRTYTLPSEAQWEYACRAGTTTPFHFGATITPELANYHGNYTYANGPKGVYREQTTPVAIFPANAWGLHDMHGNVREWCLDHWHASYEGASSDGSAWLDPVQSEEEDKKKSRLLRGGSWYYLPRHCRSACRDHGGPGGAGGSVGFRVVCLPQGRSS